MAAVPPTPFGHFLEGKLFAVDRDAFHVLQIEFPHKDRSDCRLLGLQNRQIGVM
jgi:hypothetical protein